MNWLKNLNPFAKKEEEARAASKTDDALRKAAKAAGVDPAQLPELPKDLADSPQAKGMMAMFYRKWKDPAFMKQLRTMAAHMAKDGVDLKDQAAVKAWLEKNKDKVESGAFSEPPEGAPKAETFVKAGPDVGRNDPCPCKSGKKYKKCCGSNATAA